MSVVKKKTTNDAPRRDQQRDWEGRWVRKELAVGNQLKEKTCIQEEGLGGWSHTKGDLESGFNNKEVTGAFRFVLFLCPHRQHLELLGPGIESEQLLGSTSQPRQCRIPHPLHRCGNAKETDFFFFNPESFCKTRICHILATIQEHLAVCGIESPLEVI